MIGMADCDRCGGRMPLREVFTTSELVASAMASRYQPMVGVCTCGGTLREDPVHMLAVLKAIVAGEDELPEGRST